MKVFADTSNIEINIEFVKEVYNNSTCQGTVNIINCGQEGASLVIY